MEIVGIIEIIEIIGDTNKMDKLKPVLNSYLIINAYGIPLIVIFGDMLFEFIENMSKDLKKSIKVKHVFALPFIIMFLPWVIFILAINWILEIQTKGIDSSKLAKSINDKLNTDIIKFEQKM